VIIGHEKMDIRFNQVVGHTRRPGPLILFEGRGKNEKKHVGIDSPKYICYNTGTHELEDFMLSEYRLDEQMRKNAREPVLNICGICMDD